MRLASLVLAVALAGCQPVASDEPDATPPCQPRTLACQGTRLVQCDASGHAAETTDCQFRCVDGTDMAGAHCAFLDARYLPGVCDVPASEASFSVPSSITLSTESDACNGGVLMPADGPELCIMRYGSFELGAGKTVRVTGRRALAIVTDATLDLSGTLDVSADFETAGPGGGFTDSGTSAGPGTGNGSGGAGFAQTGGAGGVAGSTTASPGGAVSDPQLLPALRGGANGAGIFGNPASGAGGGAATLVSCRGKVSVAGTVDAGGGGGNGGIASGIGPPWGGAGGGAGGYVVLQGLAVEVSGKLFANGGGGGGGGAGDTPAPGGHGADGSLSASEPAHGGTAGNFGGDGGVGGIQGHPPRDGQSPPGSGTAGGGGGSTGHFQVYVPAGVTPFLSPAEISPAFDPFLNVPTR